LVYFSLTPGFYTQIRDFITKKFSDTKPESLFMIRLLSGVSAGKIEKFIKELFQVKDNYNYQVVYVVLLI
jgi:hypothetical protein